MSATEQNIYEQQLDTQLQKLQQCQSEHATNTCSTCEHFIGCEIRQAYVNAVFSSMSKGDTGGFEF
jgi:hypothetical protein